jgi:hypothetical protein
MGHADSGPSRQSIDPLVIGSAAAVLAKVLTHRNALVLVKARNLADRSRW